MTKERSFSIFILLGDLILIDNKLDRKLRLFRSCLIGHPIGAVSDTKCEIHRAACPDVIPVVSLVVIVLVHIGYLNLRDLDGQWL